MIEPMTRETGEARHEVPEVDAAAMDAARAADRLLAAARAMGNERWTRYLATMPDRLRDDPVSELRRIARLGRSAFGPKDSIRDSLPEDTTEPFLVAIDRLLKTLARHELERH